MVLTVINASHLKHYRVTADRLIVGPHPATSSPVCPVATRERAEIMQFISVNQMKPGQVFPHHLFLDNGQKLLSAGLPITEEHIQALHRSGNDKVMLAGSLKDLESEGVVTQFDKSSLSVGQVADEGIITATGQILVEPGQEIEQHHIDALAACGAAFLSKNDSATARKKRISLADILIVELERETRSLNMRVPPVTDNSWIHNDGMHEWPSLDELTRQRNKAVDTLRIIYAEVEAGLHLTIKHFSRAVDDLCTILGRFPTKFAQLALLCPRREDYLPDHIYTVTILAMATAANLRWSQADVKTVGQIAMLYDLGMLLVPHRIRTGADKLTEYDRSRVQRHPLFSLSMMESIENVPTIVKLAAVQHHERENGTGYPRNLRGEQISDYARVLAVTDTYAAITEPRHYRKPKLPYLAMEETLRSASERYFWPPAVRALIMAAGLFPVGSFVKLSTGKNATVLEANPKQVDRPVVQQIGEDGRPTGNPIDLSQLKKEQLCVVRAIPGPSAAAA